MSSATIIRRLCSSLLIVIIAFAGAASAAQDESKNKKKKKPVPRGTPVLWRAPSDIETRDLALGPGGAEMRPNLRRVTFLKKQEGGWSTKFRVRDGAGREWVAKIGKEAQSETAAVRLVWAAGYMTEINYLAPCVRIEGAPAPGKDDRCAGGGYSNVRFEARPRGVRRLDEWEWKQNPFTGTRELRGLIVLMGLINNWDLKDTNNVVLAAEGGRGRSELRYVISDLGATFGKTGGLPLLWRVTRSRNDPEGFSKDKFVDEVEGGKVNFHFAGKNKGLFEDIPVRDARWIGGWLSRLSERQIGDAFRAANYAPDEVRMLTDAVRRRIGELMSLRGGAEESGDARTRRR